jgi:hypothetical protein
MINMTNPKFRAGGKTYKHNRPTVKKFDGKDYYLTLTGKKREIEQHAKLMRERTEPKGNTQVRVVKCPKGYEDSDRDPYSLYVSKKKWDFGD